MEANRSQFVLRLLPSFTDFAFLMPIVFLFGRMEGLKSLLGDCDTGWHIRTGEWIVANHWVPARDIFSYSKPGEPWFAWEWLSDVVFAWLNAHGGLQSVVLLAIVLLSLTFTLVFRLTQRKCNGIVAILLTMVAAGTSSIHWLARPHLFTLLFLALFYTGLERVREGQTKWAGIPYLAMFPVATVLWANLHGGFFVGFLMICAYGGGELLSYLVGPDAADRPAALLRARDYFGSALACLAASLINPYTYHLHVHMAKYLADPWNGQHVNEFLSLSFHHPVAIFFEAMLLLGAAAACWNVSRGRYVEPILIGVWAHGSLLAARNIPIYLIIATPIAGAAIQHALDRVGEWHTAAWARKAIAKFNQIAASTGESERVGRVHVVSALGLLLVAAVIWAPHPPKKFRAEFDPSAYPAAAIATLRHDPSARIFTNDEWGDYLIWRLYPDHRVFVDGRSDFYGDTFDNQYLDVMGVKFGWEQTLARFGVNTILLPPDAPLTGALKESSRWRVVYDDGVALVFRANHTTGGESISAAVGGGRGRDREVTKMATGDPSITEN
jgi:hypothetical protein